MLTLLLCCLFVGVGVVVASFDGELVKEFLNDLGCLSNTTCPALPKITTCSRIPSAYEDIITCTNDSLVGLSVNASTLSGVFGGLRRLNLTWLTSFGSSLTSLRVQKINLLSTTFDSNALGRLTSLRVLDLSDLGLTGKFPDGVVQLRRLQHLDLSVNRFNGSLFLLDKLPQSLQTLRLNSNFFVSPIASIDHLTSLLSFDISFNRLTGTAPQFASGPGQFPHNCVVMAENDTNCLNNCSPSFCCRFNCTTAVLVTPSPFPIGTAPPQVVPIGTPTTFSTSSFVSIGIAPTIVGPTKPNTNGLTKPNTSPSTPPTSTSAEDSSVTASTSSSLDTSDSEAASVAIIDMSSSDTAIAIGVGVGGGVICLLGLFAAIWLWRRSNKLEKESTVAAARTSSSSPHSTADTGYDAPPLSVRRPDQYTNVPDASNIAAPPVRRSSSRRAAAGEFVPPIKMTRRVSSRRRHHGGSKQASAENVYTAIDVTARESGVSQYVDVGEASAFATTNGGESVSTAEMKTARRRVHTVRDIYQIPVENLKLGETLGQGAFGVVVRADWNGATVAVKQIRRDAVGSSSKAMHEFKNEVKQMAAMPSHPNVVRLFGVSKMGEDMAAVVEYCGGGALSTALYGDNAVQFTARELHRIAAESASGIVHLHNHGTVHRDIAARNVLLTTDRHAKVADFGMARDTGVASSMDENVTAQDLGPIKFMAPEQLERRAYSRATDTWAFGVLLFEIFEREQPWRGVPNLRVATMVLDGGHLTPTAKTPVKVQAIMEQCFAAEPRLRIAMSDVEKQLRELEKSA